MTTFKTTCFFLIGFLFCSCKNTTAESKSLEENVQLAIDSNPLKDSVTVYKTDQLIIRKLTDNIYQHTSFLITQDFGNVPCNGMIVVNNHQAIIFDTPADDVASLELINYLNQELKCKIKALIPTHFHLDCIGGLNEFKKSGTPIYASSRTVNILKEKEKINSVIIHEFKDSFMLQLGNKRVYATYFGGGHTEDNIIGYFPDDQIIFGGCLIKEMGATKGNLEDANVANWSETVQKLKNKYPEIKVVIPGHGEIGGTELLDYTIRLFQKKNN